LQHAPHVVARGNNRRRGGTRRGDGARQKC
jgi:hypothetical protein